METTTETTHTQTAAPRGSARMARDPDRHYIKVQQDAPKYDYSSPIPDLLDENSIVDPTQAMYRIDSESARDTGHSQMVLMSCSKEDHELAIARDAKDARFRENAVQHDENSYEEVKRITQSL